MANPSMGMSTALSRTLQGTTSQRFTGPGGSGRESATNLGGTGWEACLGPDLRGRDSAGLCWWEGHISTAIPCHARHALRRNPLCRRNHPWRKSSGARFVHQPESASTVCRRITECSRLWPSSGAESQDSARPMSWLSAAFRCGFMSESRFGGARPGAFPFRVRPAMAGGRFLGSTASASFPVSISMSPTRCTASHTVRMATHSTISRWRRASC